MKCPRPARGAKGSFPCGQCIACRINKRRIWSGRIVQEWLMHPQRSFFVTMTYNPEHLPMPEIVNDEGNPAGTLDKQWFRRWIKDTQRPASKDSTGPFRYYAVGEYGTKSRRAHYHMALFPEHPAQIYALEARWKKYGFIQASEINHQRCGYLANYVTKHSNRGPLPGAEPEFRISSRNPPLGAAFAESIIRAYQTPKGQKIIQERGDVYRTFRVDGRTYPFGEWTLGKIRKSLEIPLLHRDRAVENPNYLTYFETEEPEWDEQMAHAIEVRHGKTAQKKRQAASNVTIRI